MTESTATPMLPECDACGVRMVAPSEGCQACGHGALTRPLRVVIDLMPAGNGKVWLYINGQRKGPFMDLTAATADEPLGAELRHRYMVENDAEYRAVTAWTKVASR